MAQLDFTSSGSDRYRSHRKKQEKSQDFILDAEQSKILDTPGSLEVWAGPGTGKTALLGARALKCAQLGSVLVAVFSRAAASELEVRFGNASIKIATIHGHAYDQLGGKAWLESYRSKEKEQALLTLQQDLVSPKDKVSSYQAQIDQFLELESVEQYDYVLVDEWQDLTDQQYEIITRVVSKELFVVGDPYQAIYGFQGGSWHSTGAPVVKLLNNYRNSPAILELLEEMHPRSLVSTTSGYREGTIGVLSFTNVLVKFCADYLADRGIHHSLSYRKKRTELELHDSGRESSSRAREEYTLHTDCEKCGNVLLMTYHHAKGTEFDAVCLFDDVRSDDPYLPYVGVSRARTEAYCINPPGRSNFVITELFEELDLRDHIYESLQTVPWEEIVEKYSSS